MKKLMTVLASAALAFGLYADDAVLKDGTSFESGETGVAGGVFTPDGEIWTSDPATLSDPLEIGAYADGEKLPYETSGANVRWNEKFLNGSDNKSYLTLDTGTEKLTRTMGTGNVVIDQIVKFSGFDEVQTNFVDGTKIAVWMSDIEVEGEANETNLYVTCGKVAGGEAEPFAVKITGDDWELGKWYRLTIKSIGNIYQNGYTDDARAGFVVYIDGNKVAGEDAASLIEASDKLNGAAGKLYALGQLFPAIDDANTTFTSVSYAGTGAIDDIVADAKGPAFAIDTVAVTIPTVPNATIASVTGPDGEILPEGGVYLANPGSTITITWDPATGYRLSKTSKEVKVGDEAMTVDVADIVSELIIAQVQAQGVTSNCVSVAETFAAVQYLEEQEKTQIRVTAKTDIDKTEVTGFGKIGLANTARITITPGTWAFSVAAATLEADIAAEATVTADASATFTFAGEVAGTLQADVFGANSALALAVGGQIIAKADNLEIGVPSGYTLKKTAGTEELDGYTIYTAELPPAPTYTVTFSTNTVTVAEKTLTEVAEGTELKSEQIPDFGEGTWDVEPLGAIITCDTNFNFTVKAEENWDVDPEDEDKPASEVFGDLPQELTNVPAKKLSDWAKANNIPRDATLSEAVMIDAYLLNCAPDKVAETKTQINIASIEFVDGDWVIKTVSNGEAGDEFGNGELELVDVTKDVTGAEGSDAAKLWKMKLVPITAK